MKTLITAMATGAVFMVHAASYDATTDWASVSSAGYRDGTADLTAANGWQMTDGAASVKDGVVHIAEEELEGSLKYTPAAPLAANSRQTVCLHLPSMTAGRMPDASGTLADIGIVEDDAVTNWYGWCAGGWTKLTGVVPDVACDVRIELDNRTANRLVRYSVKTTGDFVPLTTSEHTDGWLPAAASDKTGISGVAFSGKTALTGVELTQTGTVTVNDTRMKAQGIKEEDLGKSGANGNPNWENLVLGLSCTVESSIPVVQPVQTSDPNTVTLALGGVDVDTASGATVKYRVHSASCLVPGASGDVSGWKAANEVAAMALPGTGVRYYQMEVVTTPGR